MNASFSTGGGSPIPDVLYPLTTGAVAHVTRGLVRDLHERKRGKQERADLVQQADWPPRPQGKPS
jgi:hypothetical protein